MTKKVLSIDLDYFMEPTIQIYNNERMSHNPLQRWTELYDHSPFKESHFYIDQGNLIYCYHTFLKALKNNPTVVFGYDHDAILYGIKDYDSIDLVNIDHHDDVSPQYIPKNHWHYFTMFMMAYEEFTGNEVDLIDKLRFEYHELYKKTTKHILNPS